MFPFDDVIMISNIASQIRGNSNVSTHVQIIDRENMKISINGLLLEVANNN